MQKQKTIKNTISDISQSINELEKEKNLGNIVKQYNKIDGEIKDMFKIIHELQNKIRTLENQKLENLNINIVNDEQYEEYCKKISDEEIDKIINSDDLEMQIENFKKLTNILDSCKIYLENKKSIIIDCDKDIKEEQKIKDKKINKIIAKTTNKKKKTKKHISSSDSTSSSVSSISSNSTDSDN